MKKRLSLLLVFAIAVACVPSNKYEEALKANETLQKENESLKGKIELLQDELVKYQTSPDALMSKAKESYLAKDRKALDNVLTQLKRYHPGSTEANKTAGLLKELDTELEKARAAAEAKAAAEKAKRLQSVKKLKSNYDDVSGVTWYYNPYFTHYNNSNHVSIYMGKRESGKPWLRLVMSYYGDNWIFFENAYLSYDGNTMEIPFNRYDNKKTDNSGGYVWEWIDVSVDNNSLSFLKQLVEGKTAKMRLSGKYTHTKTLSTSEINGIKDVLLAYDVLQKGDFSTDKVSPNFNPVKITPKNN